MHWFRTCTPVLLSERVVWSANAVTCRRLFPPAASAARRAAAAAPLLPRLTAPGDPEKGGAFVVTLEDEIAPRQKPGTSGRRAPPPGVDRRPNGHFGSIKKRRRGGLRPAAVGGLGPNGAGGMNRSNSPALSSCSLLSEEGAVAGVVENSGKRRRAVDAAMGAQGDVAEHAGDSGNDTEDSDSDDEYLTHHGRAGWGALGGARGARGRGRGKGKGKVAALPEASAPRAPEEKPTLLKAAAEGVNGSSHVGASGGEAEGYPTPNRPLERAPEEEQPNPTLWGEDPFAEESSLLGGDDGHVGHLWGVVGLGEGMLLGDLGMGGASDLQHSLYPPTEGLYSGANPLVPPAQTWGAEALQGGGGRGAAVQPERKFSDMIQNGGTCWLGGPGAGVVPAVGTPTKRPGGASACARSESGDGGSPGMRCLTAGHTVLTNGAVDVNSA
eukprot:1196194-Prorocentrum_minimum.AAC.7